MHSAIILLFFVPAAVFVVTRSSSKLLSLSAGAITAFCGMVILTLLVGSFATVFAFGSLAFLLVTAFAEEAVRLFGLRLSLLRTSQNRTFNAYDFVTFGLGFGVFEYLVRLLGFFGDDLRNCNILSLQEPCSKGFDWANSMALQAIILHVLLTSIFVPLIAGYRKYWLLLLVAAAVVHAGVNSLVISVATQYDGVLQRPWWIVGMSLVNILCILIMCQRHKKFASPL